MKKPVYLPLILHSNALMDSFNADYNGGSTCELHEFERKDQMYLCYGAGVMQPYPNFITNN